MLTITAPCATAIPSQHYKAAVASSSGKSHGAQMRYRGVSYQKGSLTSTVRNLNKVLRYRGCSYTLGETLSLRPVQPPQGSRCYRTVIY